MTGTYGTVSYRLYSPVAVDGCRWCRLKDCPWHGSLDTASTARAGDPRPGVGCVGLPPSSAEKFPAKAPWRSPDDLPIPILRSGEQANQRVRGGRNPPAIPRDSGSVWITRGKAVEMGLTRAEQETILRWDEEEQTVHVYSSSPKTWRRAARLGLVVKRETTYEGTVSGRFYVPVPVAEFRWGLKHKSAARGNPEALAKARAGRQAAHSTPEATG